MRPMVLKPGMRVALLQGRAPQPSPARLPGPRGTAPPSTSTTMTGAVGSGPGRTSTPPHPPRGQVTPLSSPAAKRQDVRPTPTRPRQGAMSAAPISRPGIQNNLCIFVLIKLHDSHFLTPSGTGSMSSRNLWPVILPIPVHIKLL